VAWSLAVVGPRWRRSACTGCWWPSWAWPFAVLWNVAVLYVTLGFRQFSHHFTEIRDALEAGDETLARKLLAQWQRVDAGDLPRSEIVRHVIEYSVHGRASPRVRRAGVVLGAGGHSASVRPARCSTA
jgi:adenosylcobinamide-phosphate synthase